MAYVVKWIPKDQDVTIDHSTRYEHPSHALEFACNALQLSPKKIWIEDDKGTLHADHQAILEHDRKSSLPRLRSSPEGLLYFKGGGGTFGVLED